MSNSTSTEIITCKAAVVWGAGEALKVEEIQVDPPKTGEVRIKMLIASLCHTDLLCCNGYPFPLFPRVPGHEGVGMVESVGEGVTELKIGDIVIPAYVGECGRCENCLAGNTNLCYTYPIPMLGVMLDGTSRMSIGVNNAATGGKDHRQIVYQHFSCSTFSEYTVIHVNYVVKLMDDDKVIPLPHASFLSCGYSTGFGAAWKEAKVRKGSTVAVLGLGAVGLGVVEGARLQGASRIIGVDTNEMKREKGAAFGLTDFINPTTESDIISDNDSNKPISELIKDLTGGIGVDYCFECTGVASLLKEAIDSTKMGIGTAVLIGAGNKASGDINFLSILLGRTLKGCIYGGLRPKTDLPYLLDKCLNQELHLDELWSPEHQVKLDEIKKALQMMKQPDCVKVVIKF